MRNLGVAGRGKDDPPTLGLIIGPASLGSSAGGILSGCAQMLDQLLAGLLLGGGLRLLLLRGELLLRRGLGGLGLLLLKHQLLLLLLLLRGQLLPADRPGADPSGPALDIAGIDGHGSLWRSHDSLGIEFDRPGLPSVTDDHR